jgi:hypothetical protein
MPWFPWRGSFSLPEEAEAYVSGERILLVPSRAVKQPDVSHIPANRNVTFSHISASSDSARIWVCKCTRLRTGKHLSRSTDSSGNPSGDGPSPFGESSCVERVSAEGAAGQTLEKMTWPPRPQSSVRAIFTELLLRRAEQRLIHDCRYSFTPESHAAPIATPQDPQPVHSACLL